MTEFILVIIEFHYSTKTPASKLSIWVWGGGGEGSWDHIRVAREKRRECKVRFARHIKWRGCSDGFVQLRQVAICILLVRWPILARSYILRTRRAKGTKEGFVQEGKTEPILTLGHSFVCWKAPAKTIWGQFVVWWICLVIIFISFLDNSYNCQTCIKGSVGLPQERPLNTGWTVLSNACIWISVISARKCDSRHHFTTGFSRPSSSSVPKASIKMPAHEQTVHSPFIFSPIIEKKNKTTSVYRLHTSRLKFFL